MEKYGKDRGEEKRNIKPAPAGEKDWKRDQGDGRKRKERWKNMGKIEEKGEGTPNQHQLLRKSGRENKVMEGKGSRDGKIREI
jgi:hypothetical protein